jgi:thiamine-monophosphate kinase
LVSIAVSNRFKINALEELYEGINLACKNYNIDLIGGDTTSSNKGLMISVTCIGNSTTRKIIERGGAKIDDLLVVSGDLGAAYMGLQVLEREKNVFEVNPNSQPDLSQYTYCIQRQLKPEARVDVIDYLEELKIIPTSMIDISDGLSTEINHLSSASGLSFHIVEDQIPISDNTKTICEEFKIDTSIASLNGGEDYELLFTTSKKNLKKIQQSDYLSVIGTCVNKKNDNCMITSLGQKININSSGWDSFSVNN